MRIWPGEEREKEREWKSGGVEGLKEGAVREVMERRGGDAIGPDGRGRSGRCAACAWAGGDSGG